ncbi:MAG: N-acetyltransferase [Candidatus Hydrogenedentota bacterium]|nr:MAG: N-acetyltransferase [Candidatus Hydrogenedentota bacterium]
MSIQEKFTKILSTNCLYFTTGDMLEVKALENTKKNVKDFVYFAKEVYRDYPLWVPPIYSEQIKFIHEGPFLEIGEVQLFMAYRDGKPVARVTAHRSFKHNEHYNVNQGFFGFFEAFNDKEAVQALFEEASKWLKERGCDSMMGPFNFAIYDEIGVLIDAFDKPPVILCIYNPPYYKDLLEEIGFEKEIDWFAFYRPDTVPMDPRMLKVRDRILRKPGVKIRTANMKKWKEETSLVRHIFEEAWAENWGNVPFTDEQWNTLVNELKLIVKPELALIVEVFNEPVGFIISIPDANQALKKANGKLLPFGWLKILLEMRKIKTVRTIIMGILKEHRGRGYDLALVAETIERGTAMGYTGSDCSLIVENNHRMIDALKIMGAHKYKTWRIFKKKI